MCVCVLKIFIAVTISILIFHLILLFLDYYGDYSINLEFIIVEK